MHVEEARIDGGISRIEKLLLEVKHESDNNGHVGCGNDQRLLMVTLLDALFLYKPPRAMEVGSEGAKGKFQVQKNI